MIHTHHKEESQARIQNDDRCIIRSTLTMCIDPLNDASHPGGALINIINGEVCPPPPPQRPDELKFQNGGKIHLHMNKKQNDYQNVN